MLRQKRRGTITCYCQAARLIIDPLSPEGSTGYDQELALISFSSTQSTTASVKQANDRPIGRRRKTPTLSDSRYIETKSETPSNKHGGQYCDEYGDHGHKFVSMIDYCR